MTILNNFPLVRTKKDLTILSFYDKESGEDITVHHKANNEIKMWRYSDNGNPMEVQPTLDEKNRINLLMRVVVSKGKRIINFAKEIEELQYRINEETEKLKASLCSERDEDVKALLDEFIIDLPFEQLSKRAKRHYKA